MLPTKVRRLPSRSEGQGLLPTGRVTVCKYCSNSGLHAVDSGRRQSSTTKQSKKSALEGMAAENGLPVLK